MREGVYSIFEETDGFEVYEGIIKLSFLLVV